MTPTLRLATIALLMLPIAAAQAGDSRQQPMTARDRAAFETARKFSARMTRLDALMGGVPLDARRTRSADAGH